MKFNYIIMIAIILAVSLAGCAGRVIQSPIAIMQPKPYEPEQTFNQSRFTDPERTATEIAAIEQQRQKAIEKAIMLSEKYEKLSDRTMKTQIENSKVKDINRTLEGNLLTAREKLTKTEEELSQANDLLIEMRIELDNWKKNILGYRDEQNMVHTEQIVALKKILKILGAEVTITD